MAPRLPVLVQLHLAASYVRLQQNVVDLLQQQLPLDQHDLLVALQLAHAQVVHLFTNSHRHEPSASR